MSTTVKDTVRDHWRSAIERNTDQWETRDIAKGIVADLVQDNEFVMQFADEYLLEAVIEIGRKMMRSDKRHFSEMGGEIKPVSVWKKEIEREIESETVKAWTFWKWIQYLPETGTRIALPAMTKEQLVDASMFHEQQADTNAFKARFLRLIADMLSDGERVQDVLDDDALLEIHRRVEQITNIKDDSIGQEAA